MHITNHICISKTSPLYFDQWSELRGHARWRASTRRGASKDISASTSGHIGLFFRWIRLMPHIENPTNPNFLDLRIETQGKRWCALLQVVKSFLCVFFQHGSKQTVSTTQTLRSSGWPGLRLVGFSRGFFEKPWHKDPPLPNQYNHLWVLIIAQLFPGMAQVRPAVGRRQFLGETTLFKQHTSSQQEMMGSLGLPWNLKMMVSKFGIS